MSLITNHFVTALRNLSRDRYYAGLNIIGLSVAMACCFVLGLYVNQQLSYDRHNVNHERIYRVVNLLNTNGFIEDFSLTPPLVGPLLHRDYPAVLDYTRFQRVGPTLFRSDDVRQYQQDVLFADTNVFEVFTHRVIAGDPETALVDPYSIAVSESFATSFFGADNPIGQSLDTDTSTYRVTLVFADMPENSHLQYDALLSFNRLFPPGLADLTTERGENSMGSTSTFTYLVMNEGYDTDDFAAISRSFWDTYMESLFEDTTYHEYYLERLADIHLKSTTLADFPRGNLYFVYAMIAIATFLLLVACINYVNLATARATRRRKEVGVRKILGSNRRQLIRQFVGESVFFVLLAVPLGLVMAELGMLLLPSNPLLDTGISVGQLLTPTRMALVLGLALTVGILAGIYPGIYLSAQPAINNLSGGSGRYSNRSTRARHALVLVQFVISMGVITCTLLMNSQMQFLYKNSLGFTKENRLVIPLLAEWETEQLDRYKNGLLASPAIDGVTVSSSLPGGGYQIVATEVEAEDGSTDNRVFNVFWVGDDFLDVMDIELTGGRFFDRDISTDDRGALMVNQHLVEMMGWTEPLGKIISGVPVIGVVRDFNYLSLGRAMEPMAFGYTTEMTAPGDRLGYVTIAVSAGAMINAIAAAESAWNQIEDLHPFQFETMEDRLNSLYDSEQDQMSLVGIFASLCIFISSLGLLGLTAFTTEQRSKELGIRKVLGATYLNILLMLFRSIFFTVIIASVLASLMSYWLISIWLESFAYRVEIDFLIFATSTLFCVFVALFTITIQSWRTAHANPVQALRYE